MPSSQDSSYTLKPADANFTNYVNALKTYNKESCIYSISNVSFKEYFAEEIKAGKITSNKVGNLEAMLPFFGSRPVEIRVTAPFSASTIGVFPLLKQEELLVGLPEVVTESDRKLVDEFANQSITYFNRFSKRDGFDVNIPSLDHVPSLTQSQAILLLDALQKKCKVTGAMHFAEQQSMLIQVGSYNFVLGYGIDTTYLKEMATLSLDIDDGFNAPQHRLEGGYPAQPLCDRNAIDNFILGKLQSYFKSWRANKYVGELIPADQSGFYYQPRSTITQSTVSPLVALSLLNTPNQSTPAPTDVVKNQPGC